MDVLGGMVLNLDENLQLVWSWNAFDHLDLARAAIRGERCAVSLPACPPLFRAATTNDWTHTNTIHLLADGNLLISMRHQDWLIKIDYQNGLGTGEVLWKMGRDGSFVHLSDDPWPWFSGQHDVKYYGKELAVYDNGNERIRFDETAESRGQLLLVDKSFEPGRALRAMWTSRWTMLRIDHSFPTLSALSTTESTGSSNTDSISYFRPIAALTKGSTPTHGVDSRANIVVKGKYVATKLTRRVEGKSPATG